MMDKDKSDKTLSKLYDEIANRVLSEIYEKLSKEDTGLHANFHELYIETTRIHDEIKRIVQPLEKIMKKIASSPSLYEDVYKIRDDVFAIKKIIKDLEDKLK